MRRRCELCERSSKFARRRGEEGEPFARFVLCVPCGALLARLAEHRAPAQLLAEVIERVSRGGIQFEPEERGTREEACAHGYVNAGDCPTCVVAEFGPKRKP